MNHLKKFNESSEEILTISAKDMQIFANKGSNPNYPGLHYESDTSTGDFDSEKGSMLDYEVNLIDDEGSVIWEGSGGYYNGPSGESHDYPITFNKPAEAEELTWDDVRLKMRNYITKLTKEKKIKSSEVIDWQMCIHFMEDLYNPPTEK